MGEILNALTPWPMMQGVAIGLVIAAIGIWAMRKGLQDRQRREPDIEELKADWEARKHLAHLHENSFEIVKLLEAIRDGQVAVLAALNRLADARWNKHQ